MAVPIIENIAVDILAAINAIEEGDDYQHTLTAHRPTLTEFSDVKIVDKLVIIHQGEETALTSETFTNKWQQNFELTCFLMNSDKSAVTYETKVNQVRADIQKKLMEDDKRDGNAIDTVLLSSSPFNEEIGSGIRIFIGVIYRVVWNDPYTKA